MGIINGMAKFYHAYDEAPQRNQVVSTIFVMVLVAYGVACTLGGMASPWVAQLVLDSRDYGFLVALSFGNLFLSFLAIVVVARS